MRIHAQTPRCPPPQNPSLPPPPNTQRRTHLVALVIQRRRVLHHHCLSCGLRSLLLLLGGIGSWCASRYGRDVVAHRALDALGPHRVHQHHAAAVAHQVPVDRHLRAGGRWRMWHTGSGVQGMHAWVSGKCMHACTHSKAILHSLTADFGFMLRKTPALLRRSGHYTCNEADAPGRDKSSRAWRRFLRQTCCCQEGPGATTACAGAGSAPE